MQYQEKELFEGYEQRSWEFSPRIYKIIGAAAVLNLLAVFVVGQGNFLTRKGCESPLVGSICQVLDTVVLGSSLLGTDGELVSKDYDKNELENADITYIDVSRNAPPLNYPEGYFALANPEQAALSMPDATMFPTTGEFGGTSFGNYPGATAIPPVGGSSASSSDLLGSSATLPPVNPNPIAGDLPTSTSGSIASYPKPKIYKFPRAARVRPMPKIKNQSPKDLPKLDGGETTAENITGKDKTGKDKTEKPKEETKPIESEKVAEVEINKKPFEDLGDTLNEKLAKKEVDLTKNFAVVLNATLTADGKFDKKKSRFIKGDGDKEMVDAAKQALESVGDSTILGYLKNIGVDKINFTLVQNDEQIYAIIESDQKTPEKAQTTASGFNALLKGMILAHETGVKKFDDNSITLVKNSKVTNNGKNFVFNFTIPKPLGQALINKSLADRAEKKNSSQPDSNGLSQNTSK